MASMSNEYALPFKAEQYSFALKWRNNTDEAPDIDLACICFDRFGQIIDSTHFSSTAALNGAVKYCSKTNGMAVDRPVEGDDIIHMYPWKMLPECEVMLLVASAARSDVKRWDLSTPEQLQFRVWSRSENEPSSQLIADIDLQQHLQADMAAGNEQRVASTLSNGQQSMIIGGVFTTEAGWRLALDCSCHGGDNWGALVPALKEALCRWPQLVASQHCHVDPAEKVVLTRQLEDHILPLAVPCAPEGSTVEAALPAAGPGAAFAGAKVRIDVGWSLWAKGEEEEEDSQLEFTLGGYSLDGEEVLAVSADNTEGDGLAVETPEPEPEPEEGAEDEGQEEQKEEEPAADEEQAEGEAGEAEEGAEGGEEGAEGGEGEKEAAAPALQREPSESSIPRPVFPLKHHITVTLAELPKEVHTLVLFVTNPSGAGMKKVRSVHCRISDISGAQPSMFVDYVWHSGRNKDEALAQVAVAKLYKEYDDSAWAHWAGASVRDLACIIRSGDPSWQLRELRTRTLALLAKQEEATKAAQEEGELEEDEVVDLRAYAWRYRPLGMAFPGDSPEALGEELKTVLSYAGRFDAQGERCDGCARVTFPNKDTYFGGYQGDSKAGLGLYAFATGAAYLGQYKQGQRSGQGWMLLPDGGLYQGGFEGDKFSGQGAYQYPSQCCYIGQWSKGLKHGLGTYWDEKGGCLRGTWVKGVLKGSASYDQHSYRFEGAFVKGLPAGPCSFTLRGDRTADLPQPAASYMLAEWGPTLTAGGDYSIPAGAEVEPPEAAEGEEQQQEEGGDQPLLPAFPQYQGLGYCAGSTQPVASPDVAFPPATAITLQAALAEATAAAIAAISV